ncbi:hypothetical protein GTV32_20135 [Gordonia sp. SID5947]|uniref:exosortase/archaeosortase family protein n=1 Tax=Gordonia sp. SID5947 TaxID=2690315 RepID=UPI00136EDDB7|nr:exosortase/archaeosortase family protein [Gordonia sp. SID5947]MYR08467.1 hypothetical protein [Gordonia sp. SID5947]
MTTGTAPAAAVRGPGLRERLAQNPGVVVAVRWGLLLASTAIAFWQTLGAVVDEMRAGTIITYLPAAVILVGIAAVGISWRRATELPIYDRQTDAIVGVVLLLVAISVKVMNLRYPDAYLTSHVDLLALWVFLLGGACMVFGLRPVGRYGWAWLLLLMIFPVPYRMIVLPLGGDSLAAGVVMVLFGAMATGVATGRTRRRGFAGAAIAAAVGVAALIGVRVLFPDAARIVYQTVPAVGAALVASAWLYVDYRRQPHESWSPLGRSMYPVSVRKVGRPGIALVLFAVAMFFIPIPSYGDIPSARVDGLNTRPPMAVPSGWVQGSVTRYDWVTRLYGPESSMTVQDLFQSQGSTQFDKFARPRKVQVNAIEASNPLRFEVYPAIFVYDLVGDRFSDPMPVELPHGVTGYLQTIVDDDSYLTFNRLYWTWTDGRRTQRVNLLSVDNHEPDAAFPSPDLTVARNMSTFLSVLFRGNAVTIDLQPQLKDRDLLVGCATDLINTQVDAIGGES